MRANTLSVFLVLAMAFGASPANANHHEGAHAAPAMDDATFMKQAAMGGLAEVAHGGLAVTKAGSAEVKAFAQQMVKDHTKANNELVALAKKLKVALPTSADPAHLKMGQDLAKLSGADFDKTYVAAQVKDHEKTVALFEAEAKNGKIPEAKAWAAKTLPTLKMHLEHARKLAGGKTGHGEGHK